MALQERHDLANDFLVRPTCSDPARTLGSDTLDLKQSLRRVLDDLEHRLTESVHQPLGKGRADPFDETRAQVFLHAFSGGRCRNAQQCRTKLQPVFPMILPRATGLNVFAGCDRRRGAQHRDQITMPTSFDAKNTKAAVRTMESDAFNQTG